MGIYDEPEYMELVKLIQDSDVGFVNMETLFLDDQNRVPYQAMGQPLCIERHSADPIIAATYAMIAAETIGLGTCMLGAVHPFIQNGRKAKKFRENHNIKCKSKEGLFVAFGYHKSNYLKRIDRTFA